MRDVIAAAMTMGDVTMSVLLIVIQVVLIVIVSVLVRTFGAYTEATKQHTTALLKVHDSNTLLYRQAVKVLEYATDTLAREKAS